MTLKNIFLFSIFSLFAVSCTVAQPNKKADKYIEMAQQKVNERDMKTGRPNFEGAIVYLEKAIEKAPSYYKSHLFLAEIYENTKENEKAIEQYKTALSLNPEISATGVTFFYLARLEMKTGKYTDCKKHCNEFLRRRNINQDFAAEANRMVKNCDFAIGALKNPVPFDPKNLGPGVNTENPEYFPAITGDDSKLMFTRLIPDQRAYGGKQENFYISDWENNKWNEGVSISKKINTTFNEGAPTLATNGNILIFTACELGSEGYGEDRRGYGSCDLFISYRNGMKWSAPDNIGSPINTWDWETQPSFSSDGRTLYFVRGKRTKQARRNVNEQDIYVSTYDDKIGWTTPKKLGPNINTPYREESVYIHPDGQTLYFSSNGHPGMGGLDLYLSRKQPNGEWGPAINLGYPINTSGNENSLLVSSSGEMAYFASDREGGYGDLDMYGFEMAERNKPIKTNYFKGFVYDITDNKKLQAKFELIDLESGKTIVASYSDPINGEFLLSLPLNRDYALKVSKKGYLPYSENFSLKDADPTKQYVLEVPLSPPAKDSGPITLKNVFFDLDSDVLKPKSKIELDNFYNYLVSNSELKIQLRGHTDNQGGEEHNMDLSQRRAEAVMKYLINKGIKAERLSAKGFGETRPIDTNDTKEGRAKNRRTEYKVM